MATDKKVKKDRVGTTTSATTIDPNKYLKESRKRIEAVTDSARKEELKKGIKTYDDYLKSKIKKTPKAKDGKWIQKAIKKPGALRKQLGAKPGQPIPAGKLAAAAKKPGKLGQRARLAQTLKKMKKK
jgi:hypothetical protein